MAGPRLPVARLRSFDRRRCECDNGERAPRFSGRCPGFEGVCMNIAFSLPLRHDDGTAPDIQEIMNTAPMEEFVRDDEKISVEMWRDIEKMLGARDDVLTHCIAVHEPTGDYVGFTSFCYQNLYPPQAWVWNTGVDPTHRDKGLGRWIKAEMMLKVLDSLPGVERLDTFNAGSNEPMLNINVAMGFKPMLVVVNWQGDLATMREQLGV